MPPAGFEPAPLPPEGSALSPELRGLVRVAERALSASDRPRTAAVRAPGAVCRRGRRACRSSSWSPPSGSRRWSGPGARRPATSACSAAYSAISRPPWWCRIISRRNSTSNSVPESDRSSASSSSVAMPGISPPRRSSCLAVPAVAGHPGHGLAAGGRDAPQRQPALHPAGLVGLRRGDVERQLPDLRVLAALRARRWPSPRPAGGGVAMSRENPAATESAVGVAVPSSRPMPRTTASPPPSSTSPTAMTARRAVRTAAGRGGHGEVLFGGAGAVVGMSVGPIGALVVAGRPAEPARKSGFSQLAPDLGVEVGVAGQEVGELDDPLVVGAVDLQLVVPRLEADRRVQALVGGEHPAGDAVDELGELRRRRRRRRSSGL